MNTCDNALWGIIKSKVILAQSPNVETLKLFINQAFQEITAPMLRSMCIRTWRRLNVCVLQNGKQVEPYD